VNIDKLTEIAEWLEAGAPERKGVTGFDMEQFLSDRGCGTACCIAGAVVQFDRAIPYATANEAYCEGGDPEDLALHLLGMDMETADELFYGRGVDLEDIDSAWAARCIRKLIETGRVDWLGTYVPLPLQP
jgi:hypothetical protein